MIPNKILDKIADLNKDSTTDEIISILKEIVDYKTLERYSALISISLKSRFSYRQLKKQLDELIKEREDKKKLERELGKEVKKIEKEVLE